MYTNILEEGVRTMGQTLFDGLQRQDKRQRAQTETQGVPAEREEKLLYSESARALEQVVQRHYG